MIILKMDCMGGYPAWVLFVTLKLSFMCVFCFVFVCFVDQATAFQWRCRGEYSQVSSSLHLSGRQEGKKKNQHEHAEVHVVQNDGTPAHPL